jgi:XTP/dITP diphosphohydrolase
MARKKTQSGIDRLTEIAARLRAPDGCPWDREQDHMTLREHAIEEVYELIDAIEAGDEVEMTEELGDMLFQVVFHCQLGNERGAFDFDRVAHRISDKLVNRHPHVFGTAKVDSVADVLTNWEAIKRAEKVGTQHERPSALDGIPKHLPALQRAEKLVKKARKAKLIEGQTARTKAKLPTKKELAEHLFTLAAYAQQKGWSAETLLREEVNRKEKALRKIELKSARASS